MTIRRVQFGLVLLSAMLASDLFALERGIVLSPSTLNENAVQFKGKKVAVRGYITLVPEGHNLYESQGINAEFRRHIAAGGKDNFNPRDWDKFCLTIANPDPLYKRQSAFNKKTLIVRGRFVDDYLTPRTIDLGACPLPTAIVIDYGDLQKRYPALFRKH